MGDKIAQLNRAFNSTLDADVLESVLEICGGDVQATINFLRSQSDTDYIDPGPQQGTVLPKDYMQRPYGWKSPKPMTGSSSNATSQTKSLLLSDATFLDHLHAQESNYANYTAVLLLLVHKGVSLAANGKARILAAAWQRHDWALADYLLTFKVEFSLLEILKAVRILDAPRKLRSYEKKLERLNKQGTAKPKTIGVVRAKVNDLKKDVPSVEQQKTSVTGALCKKIRKWVQSIDKDQLAFFLIQLPKEPWQELSDVVHFNPSDFKLDYFIHTIFGASPPENSVVTAAAKLTKDNCLELISQFQIPYSYVRKHITDLSVDVKTEIAKYEKLDTLIWYYEELGNDEVDQVISARLDAGEKIGFSYGKLMERLLFFKMSKVPFYDKLIPIAEAGLAKLNLPLDPPVVVLGDASYSMDVAIRTATIIGSLLTALTSADLKFFNVKLFDPEITPQNVVEVLRVALNTQADGLTAPAVSIWHYYKTKQVIKFFVVVTDEIENEKSGGEFFAQLFYKYYNEVYPAKLVFVSFLEDPSQKGRMVQSLENLGLVPLQFRLDSIRPDLTKVDTLLGLLSSECDYFNVQVDVLEKLWEKSKLLGDLLAQLEDLPLPEELNEKRRRLKEKKNNDEEAGKGKQKQEEEDVPDDFICPITSDIMEEPVVAADGFTYEKSAIEAWIAKNPTSPMTGAPLDLTVLFPNFGTKSRIKAWQSSHGQK